MQLRKIVKGNANSSAGPVFGVIWRGKLHLYLSFQETGGLVQVTVLYE